MVETLALAWQRTAAGAGAGRVRVETGSADFRLADGSGAQQKDADEEREQAIALQVIVDGLEDLAKTHRRFVRWEEQRAADHRDDEGSADR